MPSFLMKYVFLDLTTHRRWRLALIMRSPWLAGIPVLLSPHIVNCWLTSFAFWDRIICVHLLPDLILQRRWAELPIFLLPWLYIVNCYPIRFAYSDPTIRAPWQPALILH